MARSFAEELGMTFLETSAKDSVNVEKAFMTMAAEIKESMPAQTRAEEAPRLLPQGGASVGGGGGGCC